MPGSFLIGESENGQVSNILVKKGHPYPSTRLPTFATNLVAPLGQTAVSHGNKLLRFWAVCPENGTVLRGTTVYRTYGEHKRLHIYLFWPTLYGPTYYCPP